MKTNIKVQCLQEPTSTNKEMEWQKDSFQLNSVKQVSRLHRNLFDGSGRSGWYSPMEFHFNVASLLDVLLAVEGSGANSLKPNIRCRAALPAFQGEK